MAESFKAKAFQIASTACAIASKRVTVKSFAPLEVSPEDLLDQSLASLGISDSTALEVFKSAIATQVPVAIRPELLSLGLQVSSTVRSVTTWLELRLAAGPREYHCKGPKEHCWDADEVNGFEKVNGKPICPMDRAEVVED